MNRVLSPRQLWTDQGLTLRSPRIVLLTMSVLGGLSAQVQAQTPEAPWCLWGGFGGGFGAEGVAAMGELVFQKSPHQLMARAVVTAVPYGEGYERSVGEIGLLYGRTYMGRQGHMSISAGLAVTDTDMDSEQGMTLGVPLVGEIALRAFPFLGLGAQGFANLNSNGSYGGLAVFLQLGYLPGEH